MQTGPEFVSGPGSEILWPVRVCAAVIRRAIVDFILYIDHSDPRLRTIGEDAQVWLYEAHDPSVAGSFVSVCLQIGLDPGVVRVSVGSLCKDDIRKLRGMHYDDDD